MPEPWIVSSPLDMHLHMRQGDMLATTVPASARLFAGAVVMPNLVPPVDHLEALLDYRAAIQHAMGSEVFEPYMTLFFRRYSRQELAAAKPHIIGIKLYPEGITTNSEGGVKDILKEHDVFAAMEQLGIPLLVHGETHGFVMDREREFTAIYDALARAYPELTIIMEHISTGESVALLDRHPNLHATVTLHHLLYTLDDMAGGLLNPHLFCKPLLKTPADRAALHEAVLGGHPRIMFGSDSAPHPVHRKECCGCAAGVFTAPVCLAMLAGFFSDHGCPEKLQDFISANARRIYGINPPEKRILLKQEPWTVPARYGDVIPLMAGQTLDWTAAAL